MSTNRVLCLMSQFSTRAHFGHESFIDMFVSLKKENQHKVIDKCRGTPLARAGGTINLIIRSMNCPASWGKKKSLTKVWKSRSNVKRIIGNNWPDCVTCRIWVVMDIDVGYVCVDSEKMECGWKLIKLNIIKNEMKWN